MRTATASALPVANTPHDASTHPIIRLARRLLWRWFIGPSSFCASSMDEDTMGKSRTVRGRRESFGFSMSSWPRPGNRQLPRQRLAARQRTVAARAWRRYTSAVVARPSPTAVRVGACALTLLAALIAAVTSADALRSIGRPWSGFGMLPDASVAPLALAPLRLPDVARELVFQDRIVAVNGAPVSSAAQVNEAVSRVPEGTPLRYTVRREGVP